MQKMYDDYKDVAEFRLVYIKEAHASDSSWPVEYAKELGITQHKNYGQRCAVASKLLSDKSLTIPTLVDDMNDTVAKAYKAWPDRVFLVRKDGKLSVAAKRGPWGFKPGIAAAKEWLASYKKTGIEPAIPEKSTDADAEADSDVATLPIARPDVAPFIPILGQWKMETVFDGNLYPATMTLESKDGKVVGTWVSQGMEMPMTDLQFANGTLQFKRSMGRGPLMAFEGKITGDRVDGKYTTSFGEMKSTGERTTSAPE